MLCQTHRLTTQKWEDLLRVDCRPSFSISDLAQEFNLTTRAIRFYEDKGLLNPKRMGQSRIYARGDRIRLIFVLLGKRCGLSLDEIKKLIDLYDTQGGRSQAKASIEVYERHIDMLKVQRRDIDEQIQILQEAIESSNELIKSK